jgi:3-hydroxyacyl-[acyl-carrier-protein] dehydratase
MSEEAGAAIDFAEVMRRIPHRYPFLFVDRAEEFEPHVSLVGIKNVTAREDFFQGHFPENPVMPGVLIIEALAQTGALLMSKSMDVDPEGKSIYFLSVTEARFRSTVRPGDTLRLSVKIIRHRGDVYKFRGEAFVDGKLAAEAEFAAMLVENTR